MGDLSRNFSLSEFLCKCPNDACAVKLRRMPPDARLIIGLEELRATAGHHIQRPVRIIVREGTRCDAWDKELNKRNKAAGLHHRKTGQLGEHTRGTAADVQVEWLGEGGIVWTKIVASTVAIWAERCPTWYDGAGGIGIGPGLHSVHLDVRIKGARWKY